MKRNDCILKKLVLLNIKSVQEGLLQLLYYTNIEVHKKRCFAMVRFLPAVDLQDSIDNIDGNIIVTSKPVNIMKTAMEFCNEHPVDSVSCKVFVNNIDFKVKQNQLWDFFEHFGKILNVYIAKDKRTRRSRGFGFVVFSSPFEAQKAMEAKKYELKLNGRVMQVLPAVKRKKNDKNTINSTEKAKLKIIEAADYFSENPVGIKRDEKIGNKHFDEKCGPFEAENCLINDTLCDDMLLEVFSYMDLRSRIRLESVCKRWYNVAIRSWKQVAYLSFKNLFNLSSVHASLTDRILITILNKNCINVKSIDLSTSPYLITHSGLAKIANTCHNLEEINLSYVLLKKDTAKVLGKNLKKLKKLHMSNCLNIGEKGYWWLFKDLTLLEELNITDTSRLIGNCVYMLPSTLTTVNFENCSEFNDIGVKYLASRCPNLQNLNLSFCGNITDFGLDLLLGKCINIVVLKLRGMGRNISKTGLLNVTHLEKLTDLDISRNIAVTDEVLQTIAVACKGLQNLNIEACHGDISNRGVVNLCLCPKLVSLNISYIVPISDECISELAMEGRLQRFIIRASPEISDRCAATCIQYLDNLRILDLSGCFYITDELPKFIEAMSIDPSSLRGLQIIIGGTQITEEGKNKLQEVLTFSQVTMQNLQVGMLRNDHDPTLVRNFFPESSDEEEEEEEPRPVVVFKPDIEFDVSEDYPTCDEDGESLWVVHAPRSDDDGQPTDISVENISSNDIHNLSPTVVASSFSIEEENWDDELNDGCVWSIPAESLDEFSTFNEDYDDFLENDDLSRLELIG